VNDLLFTHAGRINRAKFWLGGIILMIINSVIFGIVGAYAAAADDHGSPVLIVLAVICGLALLITIYGSICLGIKRYHDRGKSGFWVLIQFLPAIGALWYFIEAGCLRGTIGPNVYGDDPLGPAARAASAY
jgi:uncharacterized membrane protein YhaH (DUF805 family)